MRKFEILAVSVSLCLAIAFIFPQPGKSFPTLGGVDCFECHDEAALHDNHTTQDCSICHNVMGGIRASSSKCTTCHPLGNPASCNLVDFHDPDMGATCFNCHADCGSVETSTSTTVALDSDNDGITDDIDNCPSQANGPEGGTCSAGTIGEPCVQNGDCGCAGYCSMDQEDADEDSIGDVCDT